MLAKDICVDPIGLWVAPALEELAALCHSATVGPQPELDTVLCTARNCFANLHKPVVADHSLYTAEIPWRNLDASVVVGFALSADSSPAEVVAEDMHRVCLGAPGLQSMFGAVWPQWEAGCMVETMERKVHMSWMWLEHWVLLRARMVGTLFDLEVEIDFAFENIAQEVPMNCIDQFLQIDCN